ncbi:MAG TPA: hypothetical protein G4N93_06370, partial [Dehalococcoidia bacterium]|nr:hypothetical protein [Dehalococcoidia bacterium]
VLQVTGCIIDANKEYEVEETTVPAGFQKAATQTGVKITSTTTVELTFVNNETECHASIVGAKFQNNCCGNNVWNSYEDGIDGWWIGLFPYEYPYPAIDQYNPAGWDAWGVIQKVLTFGDNVSTPGTKDGGFTFDNVCAGIYYVVEESRLNYETCNHHWNLPLRDHYVVIVTEANALNGDTITYDVYGDNLWFGNKFLYAVLGQFSGMTAQSGDPCSS